MILSSSLRVQLGQSVHLNLVELSDVEKLLAQIGTPASETRPQIVRGFVLGLPYGDVVAEGDFSRYWNAPSSVRQSRSDSGG